MVMMSFSIRFPLDNLKCNAEVKKIRESKDTSPQDKYRKAHDIIREEVMQILNSSTLDKLVLDERLAASDDLIESIMCDTTTWRLPGKFAPPSLPDTCDNVFKVRSLERDVGMCFTLFHRSALMAMKKLEGHYGRDKIFTKGPEAEAMMTIGSYTPPLFAENGLMTIEVNYNLMSGKKPNQSTHLSEPYGGMFWIHSSRVIPKMSSVGYRLYPGKRYTVYLKKDIYVLMEPPYETQCRDYTKAYKQSILQNELIMDLGTPLSQEACLDECVAKQAVVHESCKCWPPVLPFRHENNSAFRDMKWCPTDKEEFCYSEFVKNCLESCPADCLQEHYEVVIKERKNPDPGSLDFDADSLPAEELEKKRIKINMYQPRTLIDIVFTSNEETYHDYYPYMDAISLVVDIAGLFGLFLALSMDYVIDFCEFIRDWVRQRRRVSFIH